MKTTKLSKQYDKELLIRKLINLIESLDYKTEIAINLTKNQTK